MHKEKARNTMETIDPPLSDTLRDDWPPVGKLLGKVLDRPQAILLDTPQIAAYLNVEESTILDWVRENYIPHIKFQNLVRFRKTDIDAWLDKQAAPDRMTILQEIREGVLDDLLEDLQTCLRRGKASR
jgi:excisionase family DNA binding protein